MRGMEWFRFRMMMMMMERREKMFALLLCCLSPLSRLFCFFQSFFEGFRKVKKPKEPSRSRLQARWTMKLNNNNATKQSHKSIQIMRLPSLTTLIDITAIDIVDVLPGWFSSFVDGGDGFFYGIPYFTLLAASSSLILSANYWRRLDLTSVRVKRSGIAVC